MASLKKGKRVCPNCGKEFEGRGKYCSNDCYKQHKHIGAKKYNVCVVCGKEFEYVHGHGDKTCSKECLSKLKHDLNSKEKVKSVCKFCGEEFEHESYQRPEFCSRDCYWAYRNGHKDEYCEVFINRKNNSREIRRCEMCGKEFEVYKKAKKRFCSDECRIKYQNTNEFREKRLKTMLEKYGKLSVGNGITSEKLEEYNRLRNERYMQLCKNSDMEFIKYIDKHVLLVRCKKCGVEFVTNNLSYLPYDKIYCRHCSDEYKDYKPAMKIYELLDELNISYVKNDRSIIKPYELDIYIPEKHIAIEINGNFWHSELCGKDSKYHINKTLMSFKNGIRLIHIYEDEIAYKLEIVKSRIKNILNLTSDRIFARKCNIRDIDYETKTNFLNENHIQGASNSSINYGLFYGSELVSVMTFGKERGIYKMNENDGCFELLRFANKKNTIVVGAFSKLLKHFIKNNKIFSLKTFSDIRWGGIDKYNNVYYKNGFLFDKISKPNYWYIHKTDLLNRKHRFNFTKHSIIKKYPELDKEKTEWELMQALGYNRIWDCGSLKYVWKNPDIYK